MKVVVAEPLSPAALEALRAQTGWNVVVADPKTFTDHLEDCDALIVRSAVKVTKAVLDKAPTLRVIGRAGVGVDNVDLPAATAAGVLVMNTPGGNAVSVAEHTIGLMLALARHIPAASASTLSGKWEKKKFQGTELRDKTLGIVGLGSIGRETALRAKGFQMRVIAFDPFVNPAAAGDLGIELVSLDELYAHSDYLSLHVSLTPDTEKMINQASIAKMKPGVRIINCARGELIDQAALQAALESGHVGGAGLDVFDPEPLPPGHPLLQAPNLLATPHIGGSTEEAQEIVGVRIVEQVVQYLQHGIAVNAVNMPALSPEQYRTLGPYIGLAEKLGAFAMAISSGNPVSVQLSYFGRIAELNTALVRNAGLAGLLNRSLTLKANLVNALQQAAERGLTVSERHESRSTTYTDSIRVELTTSEGTVSVEGAVILGQTRLLQVNGVYCEAEMHGHLTYLVNEDLPGVIGYIGGVLGRNQINIANFSLGRAERRVSPDAPLMAVSVIETDSPVPEAVLQELLTNKAIKTARTLELTD